MPAQAAGNIQVKEILSSAVPGVVPTLPSFCQVKIKRTVVPASASGKVTVARVYVEEFVKVGCVHTNVAPVKVVVLDAGVFATGVTVFGAV